MTALEMRTSQTGVTVKHLVDKQMYTYKYPSLTPALNIWLSAEVSGCEGGLTPRNLPYTL